METYSSAQPVRAPFRFKFFKDQRGFTLYEVLIVVAILSVVAIFAVPEIQKAQIRGKATSETENLRIIESAKAQFSRANPGVNPVRHDGDHPYSDLYPFLPNGQMPKSPWGVQYDHVLD
ncbi:MAG: type II secretion system protein, partial [Akkermansiaceae bacterium]